MQEELLAAHTRISRGRLAGKKHSLLANMNLARDPKVKGCYSVNLAARMGWLAARRAAT